MHERLIERYKELYNVAKELPNITPESFEPRGDDMGSSIKSICYKENNQKVLDKIGPDGFIYNYCLSDEDRKKVDNRIKKLKKTSKYC